MSLISDTTDAIRALRFLDSIGIPALISDNDGIIQLLNQEAGELFGEPLAGDSLHTKAGLEPLGVLLSAKQPQTTPVLCELVNHYHCLVRMQLVGRVGHLFTFENVTAYKQREEQQINALHNITHDLKAPLTSIKSYVDLVKNMGSLSEKQEQFLDRIGQSVRFMSGLVSDILDIAWIDTAHPLTLEPVNIADLLRLSLQTLENHIQKRRMTLHLKIATDLPILQGDGQRLERVFVNLISNAIKYTPSGGQIEIEVSHDLGCIVISVKDNGIGIPAEHLPHIFKRFYRVPTGDDKTEGTGLGLSIVQSIVERHQGTIEVKSMPASGSTFVVKLPIQP